MQLSGGIVDTSKKTVSVLFEKLEEMLKKMQESLY